MIAVNVGTLLTYYHLVMTNSLPWKIIMLLIGKWAIYTMAMLNNQRVNTFDATFHQPYLK